MVRSGWLKRFEDKLVSTLKRKPIARRGRPTQESSHKVELLENRSLPTASALFLSSTGELSIELGSSENIRIGSANGRLTVDASVGMGAFSPATSIGTVAAANVRSIAVTGGDEANVVDLSGVLAANFTGLTSIIVSGANGHDTLIGSPDIANSLAGGDGRDTLVGSSANDTLNGGNGDDSITAGVGNDTVLAGDGADTVFGDEGNDLLDLGDGDDVANFDIPDNNPLNDHPNAGDGDDTINGDDGQDFAIGGAGNDSLNGMMGDDTLIGGDGNDQVIGASGNDQLFGDSADPAIVSIGADTVDGGAGNDTIIGGGGPDVLDGGTGGDYVASTSYITTTNDPLPVPQVNQFTGVPVELAPALPTGLATNNVGRTFHTISTGVRDGDLAVTLDATGKFGSFSEIVQPNPVNVQIFIPATVANPPIHQFKGWAQEGAVYNPIGDGQGSAPDQTTIESGVYFRFGTAPGIPRQLLNEAARTQGTISNIFGTGTEAVSQFQIGGLTFDLTQQVQPQFDLNSNKRVGTLLTQTYVILNTSTTDQAFELVRYLDGDLNFDGRDELNGVTTNGIGGPANGVPDGASPDGGGHLINKLTGDEFLFETEQGGVAGTGNFLGITSKPNPALPPAAFPDNRFELSLFPGLRNRLRNGDPLTNQIGNDSNSDGSVDAGREGNVTFALRNVYVLTPGSSAVYTTHTVFGTGRPDQIQFNRGPNPVRDGNNPNDLNDTNAPIVSLGNEPVTIDVVKNDLDVDGTIDFTSVRIETPPTQGFAEVIGDGRIRYTPDPTSPPGTYFFTYTVADNLGSRSIPTPVFVNVNPDSFSDSINGGLGNDTLIGTDGDDTLLGGGGTDLINGGAGQDSLSGQSGSDVIIGGGGTDTLNGGIGNDLLQSVDQVAPSLFINDVSLLEGLVTPISNGNVIATFEITLDHPIEQPVTFNYTLVSGTATSGSDFVSATGTLTINPCETQITLPVTILGDSLAELSETFTIVLSNLQNALVGKAIGRGTILNNGLTLDTPNNAPAPINATREAEDNNNVQIAINPLDSTKAVMVTNDRSGSFIRDIPFGTLGVYTSSDGGRSWNPSPTVFDVTFDGQSSGSGTQSRYHPSVAYDRAGNVHIAYVAETPLPGPTLGTLQTGPAAIVYAISRDNGLTFRPQVLVGGAAGNDRPNVAVGPDPQNLTLDAVYVVYRTTGGILMQGAQVPPAIPTLPPIQTPTPQFTAITNVSNANSPNFPVASVGPTGQVGVTWQTPVIPFNNPSAQGPSTINFALDLDGLRGGLNLPTSVAVTASDVGSQDLIPALNPFFLSTPTTSSFLIPTPPNQQAYASPLLAYDRSGGPHNGRLYLAYVDEQANESDNMDIFIRFSDNNGTTFSDPVRVNDDLGFNSQFHPSLAVDQSNGVVVMGWYDCRNDFIGGTSDTDVGLLNGFSGLTGVNTDLEYFVSASYDGAENWMDNVRVSNGSTNAIRNFLNSATGAMVGNYTGITAANGVILAAWPDNSNTTGDNPDGNVNTDAYVARLLEMTTETVRSTAFTSLTDPGDLLLGGDGDDTLNGGDSGDTLNGQNGLDRLFGGCGDDLLLGGSGADTLSGSFGEDTLDGQGGPDFLDGDADNDTYIWNGVNSGNDTVSGSFGFDTTIAQGTSLADTMTIGQNGKNLTVTFLGQGTLSVAHPGSAMNVLVNGLGGDDTLTVGTLDTVKPLALSVDGGEGNDLISAYQSLMGGVRLSLFGNNGNDTLNGSLSNDTLSGGAGNDSVCGWAGDDSIFGNEGNDSLGGSLGNDTIDGGSGADLLNGQQGNDSVLGGDGNDTLKGEDGNDTLAGQNGDDNLNGMNGNDLLTGSIGMDILAGGGGNDMLDGGRNDDTLAGNTGDDLILGDHGNDQINGGDGNDTINGGDGDDAIQAGLGNDAVNGADGNDFINADVGDDTIIGGDGNDTLLGGAGRDLILGRNGNDVINGQGDFDTVAGNQGTDFITADASEIDENFSLLSIGRNLLLSMGISV